MVLFGMLSLKKTKLIYFFLLLLFSSKTKNASIIYYFMTGQEHTSALRLTQLVNIELLTASTCPVCVSPSDIMPDTARVRQPNIQPFAAFCPLFIQTVCLACSRFPQKSCALISHTMVFSQGVQPQTKIEENLTARKNESGVFFPSLFMKLRHGLYG